MKILHVITTLDVGGAEMHLLAQVRGQTARGHAVSVAFLKGHGTLVADFRAAGATSVDPLGGGAGALARLAGLARRSDVVHSHLLKADMLTAVVATLAGKRGALVSSKHNDEQVLTRTPVSLVHGVVGNLPRRTIVLSDHVGRFIERHGRVPSRKQRRIYYGLDPAPFDAALSRAESVRGPLRASFGFAPQDVVFVCVARFAAQKAHDVLLRGLAEARAGGASRIKLLLVGDDPFGDGRTRAEAVARELDLGAAVHFAGIRRDVPDIYAASEAFVMTSLWEGLGLVFLEAMATRLPVLATRVSAVPEVVVDGETGVLVPARDPSAVARAMTSLASDPERRRSLGERGRARVLERFALDRMIDETLAVYRELLSD